MTDSTMNRVHTPHAAPLAQDYTVVREVADPDVFTATPALLRLPSGRLLCSFSLVTRVGRVPGHPERALGTVFYTSADGGQTWDETGSVDLDDGLVFMHRDRLYLLCNRPGRGDIVVTASDDEGASWREPVRLFAGRFWNTFTPHAIRDDTLYWALGAPNAGGNFNRAGSRIVVVAGDLAADDLLDRSRWRNSPYLTYPGTPAGLSAELRDDVAQGEVYPADGDDLTAGSAQSDGGSIGWCRPSASAAGVVSGPATGPRRSLAGAERRHTSTAASASSSGYALIGRRPPISAPSAMWPTTATEIELRFTQFHPLPGNCYFHIIRDELVAAQSRTDGARCGAALGCQDGYFWAATSLPTRTQDLEWGREMAARGLLKGRAGNERRFSDAHVQPGRAELVSGGLYRHVAQSGAGLSIQRAPD